MMKDGQRVTKGQKAKENADSENVEEIEAGTINERLGYVFGFYKWARGNDCVPKYVIGLPIDGGKYMITAVQDEKGVWHWPYLLKNVKMKLPVIPDKGDLDDLHHILDELFFSGNSFA